MSWFSPVRLEDLLLWNHSMYINKESKNHSSFLNYLFAFSYWDVRMKYIFFISWILIVIDTFFPSLKEVFIFILKIFFKGESLSQRFVFKSKKKKNCLLLFEKKKKILSRYSSQNDKYFLSPNSPSLTIAACQVNNTRRIYLQVCWVVLVDNNRNNKKTVHKLLAVSSKHQQ